MALLREQREADIGAVERWIAPTLMRLGLEAHDRATTPAAAEAGASW